MNFPIKLARSGVAALEAAKSGGSAEPLLQRGARSDATSMNRVDRAMLRENAQSEAPIEVILQRGAQKLNRGGCGRAESDE